MITIYSLTFSIKELVKGLIGDDKKSLDGLYNFYYPRLYAFAKGFLKVDLSKKEDPICEASNFSKGRGVDGVIVAASSESDEIIHQSAEMCRKRGRIVLVGVVGLKLRRDDFFKKESKLIIFNSFKFFLFLI